MKKYTKNLLIAFIAIIAFSCNKIPNHAKYIPKNSLGVFAVDMNKLSKKLIWNVLTGSEIFDEMQKDVKNEESKKAMKDFSNIGIDPATTLYIFYTGNMKDENHPCVVAGMKDAAKFESFITKNYPELKIDDNKDYKSCIVENKFLLSWNKEVAIGTAISRFGSMSLPDVNMEVPADMDTAAPAPPAQIDNAYIESQKNYLKELYALSSSNAITSIGNFKKLQNDGHDFSLWINYEEFYKQNKDFSSAELKAFVKEEYFKDAALACGFDFEKGAVDMDMDYYLSKELASIYKKYSSESIDESLVKNIPSNDIDLLVTYNLKPKMIEEFLKEFKLDGLANIGLIAMGTSMETIMSAFKGDIVFALTDMKMKQKDTTQNQLMYTSDMPDFDITYAMSINDASSLEALLDKGVKQSVLVKSGNTYSMPNSGEAILMYDKNKLVYSNKKNTAQQFMDSKGNAKDGIPGDAWKNIVSNPVSIYADIKKMMAAVPMDSKEEAEKQLMAELKNMFTYAQIFGGKMKGNANHLEGNLFFSNKDENSMIQLINLAIKAKKAEDNKKKNMNPPAIDTLDV